LGELCGGGLFQPVFREYYDIAISEIRLAGKPCQNFIQSFLLCSDIVVVVIINGCAINLAHTAGRRLEAREESGFLSYAPGIAAVLREGGAGIGWTNCAEDFMGVYGSARPINGLAMKVSKKSPPAVPQTSLNPCTQDVENFRRQKI